MCGCGVPAVIAARPIHPKLGRSPLPVVLVMTRPWYAGLTTTCAPEASVSISTCVCCRRKATSDSKRPAPAAVRGWSEAVHPATPSHRAPTVVSRILQGFTYEGSLPLFQGALPEQLGRFVSHAERTTIDVPECSPTHGACSHAHSGTAVGHDRRESRSAPTGDQSNVAQITTAKAVMLLVGSSAIHIVVVVAQPQRVTNDELTDASTGAHALLVRVAEVDAFPHTCVDHLVDALTELSPEMIEGRVGRVVRDDGHARCITEERDQRLGHGAADFVMRGPILREWRCREKRAPAWIRWNVDAIRAADRADRTPDVVGVLGVPACDRRVGRCDVREREQPRVLGNAQTLGCGNLPGDRAGRSSPPSASNKALS